MPTIELTATLFGLACVVLTIRQHIACWPTGLVMVVLYIHIFHEARLYSDMGLQVIYVFLQLYGWYHWVYGGRTRNALPVSRMSQRSIALWLAAAAAGTMSLGFVMDRYTDASLAYWDATTTVLSLIAQYLMARKLVESWLFWIVVDILAIGIYLVKDLHLTAGLYAVFLVLATIGFFAWLQSLRVQVSPMPVNASA